MRESRIDFPRNKSFAIAALALVLCAPRGFAFGRSKEQKLLDAATAGDTAQVRSLLDRGAKINARDQYGNTALILAQAHGHLDAVKLLIERGADVNAKNGDDTVLLLAAIGDHKDIIKLLLDHGADINVKGNNGWTALMWLANWGHSTETIKFLLDHGADIDARNTTGETALLLSAWNDRPNIIQFLLDHGADVNAKNKGGETALMRAMHRPSIVGLLLGHGADVEAKDNFGETAMDLARSTGRGDIVTLLKSKKCFSLCYVAVKDAELKDVAGAVLTRLPLGTMVRDEKEGNGYAWVRVGTGLAGWLSVDSISAARPDMFDPIIRLLSQSLDGADINVKGVVYSDMPLKTLAFGTQNMARAPFEAPKGNYRYAYPFEGSLTLAPGTRAVLTAQDEGNRRSELAINVQAPVLDYTPQFAHLRILRTSSVLSEPRNESRAAGRVLSQSVVVSVGRKGEWYYLEGGGWLAASNASEMEQPASESSPGSVSMSLAAPNASGPEVISKPSDVDVDIPLGKPNPKAVAVIIANRDYTQSGVPAVEFALNDGRVMKKYLERLFGIPEENILYQENAGKASMEALFGTEKNAKGKLYNYVFGMGGKPDVFIYYVGHGAPAGNQKGYLVPVDADPGYVELQGYPVDQLYANLGGLSARSVTVILDACFSGQSPKGTLIKSASPLVLETPQPQLPAGVALLSAAGPREMASWNETERHSLFTYYLLQGLKNRAGTAGAAQVTLGAIGINVRSQVERAARKLFNRDQTPQFYGSLESVLARYQ